MLISINARVCRSNFFGEFATLKKLKLACSTLHRIEVFINTKKHHWQVDENIEVAMVLSWTYKWVFEAVHRTVEKHIKGYRDSCLPMYHAVQ
jgi:hypothetical protein